MRGLGLKCFMVLFLASAGFVFAKCPEIDGTFLCNKASSEVSFTTTISSEGQYVYGLSYTASKTQELVVESYVADGVSRMVESKKQMSFCAGDIFKTIFMRRDSPYVDVRELFLDGDGRLVAGFYIAMMEHEKPETLRVLREKRFLCDRQ